MNGELSQAELRLAEIIWNDNPIQSAKLIKTAELKFGWKRTTTYTFLKRMSDKGVVRNENSIVTAVISRDEFFAGQSHSFVDNTFGGSLPLFITSFIKGRKLSPQQATEIRQMIDEHTYVADSETNNKKNGGEYHR